MNEVLPVKPLTPPLAETMQDFASKDRAGRIARAGATVDKTRRDSWCRGERTDYK